MHISLTKTVHLLESEVKPLVLKVREGIKVNKIRLPVVLLLKKVIIIDNFVAV